jgi:hypothetical protein
MDPLEPSIRGGSSMKRLFLAAACSFALTALVTAAFAAPPDARHASGGVGFHDASAPLGLRWWLSGQKMGIDVGLGLSSRPAEIDPSEKETGFALDLGVPFIMHSWDAAHVIFRPGILYQSQEVGFDAVPGGTLQFDTDNQTTLAIQAELEAEVFLRDNVSVSASNGIAFSSFDPGRGADSQSSFETIGHNFTNIGFHVYFLGLAR